MSDPLRSDTMREIAPAPDADREARIEQLLLAGLEDYFAGRYDQAINVWTRVLFFDRGHARARAYIERARTAQAEHQRESEELLQHGVAAFDRGESVEARRLLESALAQGAPPDQALAVLDRLTRLEQSIVPVAETGPERRRQPRPQPPAPVSASRAGWIALALLSMVILGAAAFAAGAFRTEWRSLLDRPLMPVAPVTHQADGPPMPRRGEMALERARAFVATGHLREGLTALDAVAATDQVKADADRLRADIQRQLIDLMAMPEPQVSNPRDGTRP
jgi:hypothetical protein